MRLPFLLTNAELSTNGNEHQNGAYVLLKDDENPNLGVYDKPLPCFGCGIGWFSSVPATFSSSSYQILHSSSPFSLA